MTKATRAKRSKDSRAALLASAQAAVKKTFRGSVSDIATRALEFPSVWASTGSLALDRLCAGVSPGGVPMGKRAGRILHIAGEWSVGKSLLLDELFQSVIVDLKGLAKVSETEGTRDPHFANAIGLPLDLLVVDRPDTIEQMFDMFMEWHDDIRSQDEEIPVIWGVDSLDSTEAEKSAKEGLSQGGGWHYGGGRAEVLGVGLRRIANKVCARYPTTVVLLNQTRDNVGVMFGPKKRTPGGNPPHFYASLELMLTASPRPDHGYVRDPTAPALPDATVKRLGLYGVADKKARGAVVGRYIRAKCTKTKMSTTLDAGADFYIDFRKGIHKWEGLDVRLYAEGYLKTPDLATDYEFAGQTFKTKKDWLNWVAQNPDSLVGLGGVAAPQWALPDVDPADTPDATADDATAEEGT